MVCIAEVRIAQQITRPSVSLEFGLEVETNQIGAGVYMRVVRLIVLMVVAIASFSLHATAAEGDTAHEPPSELILTIGGVSPLGNFSRYAEVGFMGAARVTCHPEHPGSLALFLNVAGMAFSSEDEGFVLEGQGISMQGTKTVDQYAAALHLGFQIGSGSRRSFFRPRLAIGPGMYLFNTETSWRIDGDDEDLREENEWQTRFGWRGILGTDLFISTQWAITIDFTYDYVWNLHHLLEIDELGRAHSVSKSARFEGIMIGVALALDKLPAQASQE